MSAACQSTFHVTSTISDAMLYLIHLMWQYLRQCTTRLRQVRCYGTKPSSAEEAFIRRVLQKEKEKAQNAPEWEKREQALRKRYGQWNPTHKLSRQQMNDIRELKQQAPQIKTIQIADFFNVNPESIRRILKSKWVPKDGELKKLEEQAEKRKASSIERRRAEMQEEKVKISKKDVSSGFPISKLNGSPKSHSSSNSDFSPKSQASLKSSRNSHFSRGTQRSQASRPGHGKHPKQNDPDRRKKRPYTEGIGDLIE